MKKSNVIILVLLTVCSAFLLWLWYFLGLNHVDEPLDLVLSVLWWVVVAVSVAVIAKTEQIRRRRIRTVYVGEGSAFNSERGIVHLGGLRTTQDVLVSILENLKYDFNREDFPKEDDFTTKYFVRTKEFKADEEAEAESADQAHATPAQTSGRQRTWKGEVVVVDTKEERPFDTPEELEAILADLDRAA